MKESHSILRYYSTIDASAVKQIPALSITVAHATIAPKYCLNLRLPQGVFLPSENFEGNVVDVQKQMLICSQN